MRQVLDSKSLLGNVVEIVERECNGLDVGELEISVDGSKDSHSVGFKDEVNMVSLMGNTGLSEEGSFVG